jgi:mannose-6-phosphate isomerase-like protein (cupin superfamily)
MSGNDAGAKATVAGLLADLGWAEGSIVDLGGIQSARGPEHYFLMFAAIMQSLRRPTVQYPPRCLSTTTSAQDNRPLAHTRPGSQKEQPMTEDRTGSPESSVPPDDPHRHLTVARPDQDESLPHIGLVGDTYTILVTGDDTAGKYTLIDMHIPPGGGPPPHRHDFEEMFTVLEGEVELSFPRPEPRGQSRRDGQRPG